MPGTFTIDTRQTFALLILMGSGAKTEFGKFGKLMDKVEGDVGKIQKTLGEVGVRTRAINRTLREVSDPGIPTNAALEFEDFVTPNLSLAAATGEDDENGAG